jgi:tRNA G18 (ribose-2'-O)-methylase SpoU
MSDRIDQAGQAVRCPEPRCATVFELEAARLGRSVRCPACGVRLTARPLAIEAQLRAQQARIEGQPGLALPRLPIAVLLDDVRSLWNVGSILRTADACGVRQVVLSGITGCPPRVQISKTALGAERAVAWSYRADAVEALAELVGLGYVPVALETTSRARPLDAAEWPAAVCLVVGSEVAGVSPQLLEACPRHVSIPMRGVKDSLNVAVAFGIVVHHVSRVLAEDEPLRDGELRT